MNFEPGQVLAYKADPTTCGICKVLQLTESAQGTIVNILIYRNWYNNPPETLDTTELQTFIRHVPVSLNAMQQSECQVLGMADISEAELAGYNHWLENWQLQKTGYFPIPISQCVEYIIEEKAKHSVANSDMQKYAQMFQSNQNPSPRNNW